MLSKIINLIVQSFCGSFKSRVTSLLVACSLRYPQFQSKISLKEFMEKLVILLQFNAILPQ